MDSYFSQEYVVKRLLGELTKHRRLIIALDFDDTIFDCHNKGHNFDKVITLIKECCELNFRIIIFTASVPERYPLIREHCERLGIKIEGINKNVDGLPEGMGSHGKIYYNILLDDRAGLHSSYLALREVVDWVKKYNFKTYNPIEDNT